MKEVVYKLPSDFIERMKLIFPPQRFSNLMHTFTQKKPTTFRVNSLKISPKEVKEALEKEGFKIDNVSWYKDAFVLRNKGKKELIETKFYKEGSIYIQGLSSMIPPLILEPQPDETILDLASAPGSKTTQMAVLMKNKGKIIAVEKTRDRFFKLLRNLEHQGITNTEAILGNGEKIWFKYKEYFDKVLLDAPCSSEGRFDTTNPKTYLFWKEKKIKEMVHKQKKLLFSAIQAVKLKGLILYSTCTFSPEENEGVINWVLKKFENKIVLKKINLKIPNIMPGLKNWRNEEFSPYIHNCIRLLPTFEMEGFFLCLIQKIASL